MRDVIVLGPCNNHRAFLLSERSEQVKDERVNVRAKFSDDKATICYSCWISRSSFDFFSRQ